MVTSNSGYQYAMPIPWSKAYSHALKNGAPALAAHIASRQYLKARTAGDCVNASKWAQRLASTVIPRTELDVRQERASTMLVGGGSRERALFDAAMPIPEGYR